MPTADPATPWGVVAMFAVAGTLHLIAPHQFERMVPPWLPAPRTLVYASGVAELAGAAALLVPALRPAAGWGLIALLVAVSPANVQMVRDAWRDGAAPWMHVALWARLSLQPLLVWWVWRRAVAPGQS